MKYFNAVFMCLLLIAQASLVMAQSSESKPQKVLRIIYKQRPPEWYAAQARLWEKEVNKDPKSAEAWENYYLATE